MKRIVLLGELGKKFGKNHRLDVKNPAEAIRAFVANFPEFEKFVCASGDRGVGYKILVNQDPIAAAENIHDPCGDRDVIKIVPVLAGAKSALGTILIGAALIAAAFFIPGGIALAGGTLSFGAMAFGMGVSLVLGGVSQMLSPQPKTEGTTQAANTPSYAFNGPVNTVAQGSPVPVGYGRMIVGSAVISGGISVEDIPV